MDYEIETQGKTDGWRDLRLIGKIDLWRGIPCYLRRQDEEGRVAGGIEAYYL